MYTRKNRFDKNKLVKKINENRKENKEISKSKKKRFLIDNYEKQFPTINEYDSLENKTENFIKEPIKVEYNTYDCHRINKKNLKKWLDDNVFYKRYFNMCNLILGVGNHSINNTSVLRPYVKSLVININNKCLQREKKWINRFNIMQYINDTGYTIYKTTHLREELLDSKKIEKTIKESNTILDSPTSVRQNICNNIMTVVEKRKYKKGIERYNITDIFSCKFNCGFTGCHNDVYIHENKKCKKRVSKLKDDSLVLSDSLISNSGKNYLKDERVLSKINLKLNTLSKENRCKSPTALMYMNQFKIIKKIGLWEKHSNGKKSYWVKIEVSEKKKKNLYNKYRKILNKYKNTVRQYYPPHKEWLI
jgi:hypothetical protein